jgi:cytochrome oxidase Cu insertion factor (SCO1/SenC/PrrC family)
MSSARGRYLFIASAGLIIALSVVVFVTLALKGHASADESVAVTLGNPNVDAGDSAGDLPAPQFALRDQDGRLTSLAEFRGKVVLLAFVDSQCTTICPLTTESMVQALRLLGPAAARVQLLGIDANPLAIKVTDVAAYTRAHQMQGQWRFLTGSLPELERVWRSYHVYVAAVHNDIDHEPIMMLIDQHGRERTIYFTQFRYEGILQQAQVLADGISRLLVDHPVVHDEVSLKFIRPLEPTAVVRLPALGQRPEIVVMGRGHPHLLLFFAGWLFSTSSDLQASLAALDSYAVTARRQGWPPPAAVDELPTEASAAETERLLTRLATSLSIPIVEDAQGRLGDGYGVQDLPWFVLTTRSGRVLWHYDGWLPAHALEEQVRVALAGS